jgi:hypothetical protein
MRLLTVNLNLITQNILKDFIKAEKFGTVNECKLPAGKSGSTF